MVKRKRISGNILEINTASTQMSTTKKFENKRWLENDQVIVFRHTKTLEMIYAGQNVLDIGCGDGLLLGALIKKGVSASGVDLSEEAVKKCKEKGFSSSVVDVSSEALPFKDNTFDTVVMLDVLEHVYVPGDLLEEAKRVSRKYIIIGVPNFSSLPARLQVAFGRVPENNKPNKGHIYWFNYDVLMEMLRSHKLKPVVLEANVFWENKPVVGRLMKFLVKTYPSFFALSFIIKVEKF